MEHKLFDVRFLIFWFLSLPLQAQFTYTMDQSVPVEVDGALLQNAWAGGLNSAQINTMDLNFDGTSDLVIYDVGTSRITTFLAENNSYRYAPQYEIFFPPDIQTFFLLRDFDCDGRKDLFTFGGIGILVYQNISLPGKSPSWKKLKFFNSSTGLYSEVLLTKGFLAKINLLPGSSDIPDFVDMDGDGDLDVLNMRFVSPSTAEYHKNFSMERYGRCDSLDLERKTSNFGGFLECSCGKIAFQGQTCADIGGRVDHTGGKAMLSLDTDNDGDKDLLFTEESCVRIYHMENIGTAAAPVMNNLTLFPLNQPVGILSFPAPYLEDVDHDGVSDFLASPNLHSRTQPNINFRESIWFYKNTGSNQAPVFSFRKNNFLQDEMIEVGDLSAPAFTDIDLDSDLDMFVGNYLDPDDQRGSLTYYENTGTRTNPSFQFVTSDFAGLSFLPFFNIRPQFIDLDTNGAVDLVFTATNGGTTGLYYMLSKSATVSFIGQPFTKIDIPIPLNGNATVTDVDLDGHFDVLVGNADGSLSFWKNSGTGFVFSVSDDSFLGLDNNTSRQFIAVAVGDLDGDDREDLVMGEEAGILSVFSDFRSAGSNPLPLAEIILDDFSQTYTSRGLGGSTRPAIANIFGVDKPSLVVGNRLGGLQLLKHDNGLPLSDTPLISLYPNPVISGESIAIKADRGVTMELFTVLGTRLGVPQLIPGNQTVYYPLQGIASGVYIARFTAGSSQISHRFVIR